MYFAEKNFHTFDLHQMDGRYVNAIFVHVFARVIDVVHLYRANKSVNIYYYYIHLTAFYPGQPG